MKKLLIVTILLLMCILTACTQSVHSPPDAAEYPSSTAWTTYHVPYVSVDLEDEPYKVTKHLRDAHTGDILIDCVYDELHHLYRLKPNGEIVNMFEFDWEWNHARLLDNGNYLMGEVDKRIIEVNPKGEIVWELDMPGLCHQTVLLSSGNLLVGLARLDGFIEVTRSGEVSFEWYAEDHIDTYDPTNFKGLELIHRDFPGFDFYCRYAWNAYWPEWTHLNFAQKLPNGNYIASLRNQDLVIEVDGKSGEIVWSWGPGIIKHQHTPIVYGDYMYVFDNGNGRVLKVNRNTGRIVLEIQGLLAPMFGDVRRLPNGNLLITDSFHNRAFEINEETGEVVWEIQACSSLYRVWAEGTW